MSRNLQNIDKLFTNVVNDHKEEPPGIIWQQIENDLNRRDAEKYRAKYYSLKRTISAVALVCACLLLNDLLQFVMTTTGKTELNNLHYSIANKSNVGDDDLINAVNSVNPEESLFNMQNKTEVIQGNDINYKLSYETAEIFNKRVDLISAPQLISNSLSDAPSVMMTSKSLLNSSIDLQPHDQLFNSKQNSAKAKHDFFIIPYASLDEIEGRLEQEYEYNNEKVSDYTKRENPDRSYTAGLLFEYGLSKRISLQSGVLLSNAFTSISPTVVKALPDNSGTYKFKLATTYGLAEIKRSGIPDPQSGDSILVTDAMVHLTYFSIPLLTKVKLKQGKFAISGTAGVAFNKITGDKAEVSYITPTTAEMETVEKIEGVKKSFFSVIAGAEAAYSFNKNISAGISPVVRYSVTPVNKGTPVKTYPISIGLGATVQIKL